MHSLTVKEETGEIYHLILFECLNALRVRWHGWIHSEGNFGVIVLEIVK